MARNRVYDMMRDRAKDIGYKASSLPDAVWDKYTAMDVRRKNLVAAKLYMENYMMGNLEPSEFAQAMAENDSLRYTVSDLCRIRLEPRELDIQRSDRYVDIGAGVKTFWSEIRVPLPSEQQAARDIRNINAGVEAGMRQAGRTTGPSDIQETRKRSLKDRINEAKQKAAAFAVEKLTPIAEGNREPVLDESWFETPEGQDYKNAYTRKAAQQVENVVMNIEAGRELGLEPAERQRAYEAAGMEQDQAQKNVQAVTPSEYVINMERQIEDAYRNGGFKNKPRTVSELQAETDRIPTDEYYKDLYKNYVMQQHEDYDPADKVDLPTLNAWRDQLKNEYMEAGKLARRSGYTDRELNSPTDKDLMDMLDNEVRKQDQTHEQLRSGYSLEELNEPVDTQMKELMDQIASHMRQDAGKNAAPKQEEAGRDRTGDAPQISRDNKKIHGIYDGKEVSFKNSWSSHKFTDEEAAKLLAGESITFEYENRNNEIKTASGKLEWQQYDGREFLGFKAEYGRKQEKPVEKDASDALFTEQDEQVMNQPDGSADYYEQLARDMENYQPEDGIPIEYPEPEEVVDLSADDLARLFDEGQEEGMHL